MTDSQKPIPVVARPGEKTCPVCGKPSYSPGGIHPQCAMQLADAPRTKRLKVEKQADAKRKSKAKKPKTQSWNKKKCPKCGAEVHVRIKVCVCDHGFFPT